MPTTSTLAILGQLGASITWENTGSLGSIAVGDASELYVNAIISTSTFSLIYELSGGSLPPGLSLNRDGTISGSVEVNTSTFTTSTIYNFDISAIDIHKNSFLEGNFSITTVQSTNTEFTKVFVKPLLKKDKRVEFRNFITDENIFSPDLIYRPFDRNFGIKTEISMYIHFGIKVSSPVDYWELIQRNFMRRRFMLGPAKSAIAKDDNNEIIHELVYVDVLDRYETPSKTPIDSEFVYNGVVYYPPGTYNMRERLTTSTTVTGNFDPRFTKTVQPNSSVIPGYVRFIPLCFVIPNKSRTLLNRIKDSNFRFNTIDFEIDRIYFEKTEGKTGNKYLLLEREPTFNIV